MQSISIVMSSIFNISLFNLNQIPNFLFILSQEALYQPLINNTMVKNCYSWTSMALIYINSVFNPSSMIWGNIYLDCITRFTNNWMSSTSILTTSLVSSLSMNLISNLYILINRSGAVFTLNSLILNYACTSAALLAYLNNVSKPKKQYRKVDSPDDLASLLKPTSNHHQATINHFV